MLCTSPVTFIWTPYKQKISRDKNFANFVINASLAKVQL